jgi:phage tail-like protein
MNQQKMKKYHFDNPDNSPHILDSGESGCIWHRLQFEGVQRGLLQISVYASDNCGEVANQSHVSLVKKLTKAASCDCTWDILLHDCVGRYLLCEFCFAAKSMSVTYPAKTLLDYLPELYRESLPKSFTDRYLSIFGALYDDTSDKITNSDKLYDIETTDSEFLPELACWLGIDDVLLWGCERLKDVIRNAAELRKTRGTLDGLELVIKLYCNEKAYFVEGYHIKRYFADNPDLRRLYPDYGNMFTLWIFVSAVLNENEKQTLEYLINQNKPAHVEARLIIPKQAIVLGDYAFLGLNSVVADYPCGKLNGTFNLDYGVLG